MHVLALLRACHCQFGHGSHQVKSQGNLDSRPQANSLARAQPAGHEALLITSAASHTHKTASASQQFPGGQSALRFRGAAGHGWEQPRNQRHLGNQLLRVLLLFPSTQGSAVLRYYSSVTESSRQQSCCGVSQLPQIIQGCGLWSLPERTRFVCSAAAFRSDSASRSHLLVGYRRPL